MFGIRLKLFAVFLFGRSQLCFEIQPGGFVVLAGFISLLQR
jgi:hypothetical protein